MKQKNGFVISTTLYSIFGIMLLTVFYILYLLSNNRYVLTSSIDEVKSGLEEPSKRVYLKIVYDDNQYSNICDNFSSNITCEADEINLYENKYLSNFEPESVYYVGNPTYNEQGHYRCCDENGKYYVASTQLSVSADFMGMMGDYLLFAKRESTATGNINSDFLILSAININGDLYTINDLGTSSFNIIMGPMNLKSRKYNCLSCDSNNSCSGPEVTLEDYLKMSEIKKISDSDEYVIKFEGAFYPESGEVCNKNKIRIQKNITYYYKLSVDDLMNRTNTGFLDPDLISDSNDINSVPSCSNIDYVNNSGCTLLNSSGNNPVFYTSNTCMLKYKENGSLYSLYSECNNSQLSYSEFKNAEATTFVVDYKLNLNEKIEEYISKNYSEEEYPTINNETRKFGSYSSTYIPLLIDLPSTDALLFYRYSMYNAANGKIHGNYYFITRGKKTYETDTILYTFNNEKTVPDGYDAYYYIILGQTINDKSRLSIGEINSNYKKIIYLNDDTKSSEFSENLMGSTQIVTGSSDIIKDIKEKIK